MSQFKLLLSFLSVITLQVCNAAWSVTAAGQYQPAVMDLLVERAYCLLSQQLIQQQQARQRIPESSKDMFNNQV